ncbi:hypothetical protein GCK32_016374 [Trichostrongylus colubriformis]|uniref:Uncharacterized protein n=1 Tax=Trichostrongylus colubriformis TaxID=6319 RepID=A0AAN8FBJ1_TRICO
MINIEQFVKFKASFDDYVSKLPTPGQAPLPPPCAAPAGPLINSPCASPMEPLSPRPLPVAQQAGATPAPYRPMPVNGTPPVAQGPVHAPCFTPAGAAPLQGAAGTPALGFSGGPPVPTKNVNASWPSKQVAANAGGIPVAPSAFSPSDQGVCVNRVAV